MENCELESIIESFKWNNPANGNKVILGKYIENGVMINGNPEERKEEIDLLDSKGGKEIGWGGEAEVFLYKINGKNRVVKRFHNWRQNLETNGLLQFRCARKIKEMGIETPEVYAANEKVVIMDYIPHPMLFDVLHLTKGNDKKILLNSWKNLRSKLIKALPEESIDMHPEHAENGYLKPVSGSYVIGVYDQG